MVEKNASVMYLIGTFAVCAVCAVLITIAIWLLTDSLVAKYEKRRRRQ